MIRVFAVNESMQGKPPLAMLMMMCNRCSIRCGSTRLTHGAEQWVFGSRSSLVTPHQLKRVKQNFYRNSTRAYKNIKCGQVYYNDATN